MVIALVMLTMAFTTLILIWSLVPVVCPPAMWTSAFGYQQSVFNLSLAVMPLIVA